MKYDFTFRFSAENATIYVDIDNMKYYWKYDTSAEPYGTILFEFIKEGIRFRTSNEHCWNIDTGSFSKIMKEKYNEFLFNSELEKMIGE